MKKLDRSIIFISLCLGLFVPQEALACRFWGAVAHEIMGETVTQQLLEMPNSLKYLGTEYPDGWAIGYYENGQPTVFRGSEDATSDQQFDQAVLDVAARRSNVVVAHLRRASSGCVEGVPNPHPFQRTQNGKTWLFGHNGGIKKELLIRLIGNDYLENHEPTTCTYDPPDSWVDSELYFIFLLKQIEKNNGNVEAGLMNALRDLSGVIEEEHQYLNFFLTDGQSLWAFRKGTSLYYTFSDNPSYFAVTSTPPDNTPFQWIAFPEGVLAVSNPDTKYKLIKFK